MTQTALLGDVAEVLGGGTPSTKNPKFWSGSIPWITPRDLSTHLNMYIESGDRHISQAGLDGSSAKLLPAESVIFSSRAPIGYVTIASVPMTTNQGCKGIICDESRLHNKFLYYWLKLNKEKIENLAGGSTFKEISTTGVRELEISLPDIEAQKKIADILGTIDEKIELNWRMNETLEQMGQALFRHYFIDNPEAEKWQLGVLSDISEVLTGKGSARSQLSENGVVPLYGANGVMGVSEDYLYDEPLIITGRVGTLGEVRKVSGKAWFSDNVLIMRPASGYFGYVYNLAKSFDYTSMNRGSSQPLITQTDLRNHKVKLPDENTLSRFELQSADLFKQQQANDVQTQILTTLRDILLPWLISGKVKV